MNDHCSHGSLLENVEKGCTRCLLLSKIVDKIYNPTIMNPENDFWQYQSYRDPLKIRTTVLYTRDYTLRKRIEMFATQDSVKLFPELPYRLKVKEDTSSKDSLLRAKEWILRCSQEHQLCLQSHSLLLLTRVVDIDGRAVKLIESAKLHGRYIALSHCWGDSRPDCLTTSATIVRNKSEIPWKSLSNTFRDAVEVTRKLGVRYLWIDSLCIIQDDKMDWEQESSKMASVYQHAYVTICAAVGRNGDAGLWPRIAPKLIEEVAIEDAGKQYKVYFRDIEDALASHMNFSESTVRRDAETERKRTLEMFPLITRGWTLQERILSPRVLYYGHEGSVYVPGVDVTKSFRNMMSSGRSDEDIAGDWRVLVEHYSYLNLTEPKDVLPAISALARVCSTVRPGDCYLAGLWEKSIVEDMCWHLPAEIPTRNRPYKWRAPTYSWASVHEAHTYDAAHHYKNEGNRARLIRSSTVLAGLDPMGQVLSGFVVLKGLVKTARFTKVDNGSWHATSNSIALPCYTDTVTDLENGLVKEGAAVLCLRLTTIQAGDRGGSYRYVYILMLSAIEGECDIHQRIGMIKTRTETADTWFSEGSHERELEIR